MKLSHSKLSTILSCPMTYYLNYVEGISKKEEKSSLAIGSAVHWGIEHNTDNLTEYYGHPLQYTSQQLLSEAMVHGYLKQKEDLFNKILTMPDGTKAKLLEENHELYLSGELKSLIKEVKHEFVGIIDLLLLTDRGFIIIDYKTSTYAPNWDNYLDQIYRYIFLLRSSFPDVPICKIGIINIRKTAIRQKKTENESQFLNRMKLEYEINDGEYVVYHEYLPETLDPKIVKEYIENLSRMADTAEMIENSKCWFINFSAANGQYGKSEYWDIFYKSPDAYLLYKIKDTIAELNYETNKYELTTYRDCIPIDMQVIDTQVMNHYFKFKKEYQNEDKKIFFKKLKEKYVCDEDLLEKYWFTLNVENEI